MPEGLIFVVFADLRLLGLVLAEFVLGGTDLGLQQFLLGFQLLNLGPSRFDGGLFGGDLLLHQGDLTRDGLDLRLQTPPVGIAILQNQHLFKDGCEHGGRTLPVSPQRSIETLGLKPKERPEKAAFFAKKPSRASA